MSKEIDTVQQSREAHERFAQQVTLQEQAYIAAGLDPATGRPSPDAAPDVQPNKSALARLSKLQSAVNPKTGKRFYEDPQFRERLERARVLAFKGKTGVKEILDLESWAASGLKPAPEPAASKPAARPAPPQGTPAERALARLEAGDVLEVSELPAELLHGYRINLPSGFGLTGDDVADLAAARAAGLSQGHIDAFIRQRVAQQT